MNITAFSSPVFVKSGAYLVQEIADLEDAIDFLEEWPEDRRSLIHETALRACYQAHGGFSPMSVARDALLALRSEPGSWKTLRPFCHGSLLPNRAAARCRCRRIRRPRRQIRPGKYPGLSGIAVRAYRTRISRQGKAPDDHSSTAIAASLKTVKAIAKRAAIHIRGKARQGKGASWCSHPRYAESLS